MTPKTSKEIQQYKVKTVIFLLIILALTCVAIHQFYHLQEHNTELQAINAKLSKANNTIALQDTVIQQQKIIETQKLELDTAIMLLGILVNEQDSRNLEPSYILENLNQLADEKRAEIAAREKDRAVQIKKLFSSSEAGRKEAQRQLIRTHSEDKKLVGSLHDAVNGKVNTQNQNTVYRILYIFEQLSYQSLHKEETRILAFFDEIRKQNMAGASTRQRIKLIQDRLKG